MFIFLAMAVTNAIRRWFQVPPADGFAGQVRCFCRPLHSCGFGQWAQTWKEKSLLLKQSGQESPGKKRKDLARQSGAPKIQVPNRARCKYTNNLLPGNRIILSAILLQGIFSSFFLAMLRQGGMFRSTTWTSCGLSCECSFSFSVPQLFQLKNCALVGKPKRDLRNECKQ